MLLRRSHGLLKLGAGVTVTSFLLHQQSRQFRVQKLYCDSIAAETKPSSWSYTRDAQTPVLTSDNRVNPSIIRQISIGSVTGAVSGIILAMFSRTLVVLAGLFVATIAFIESKGIRVVPYGRLQKYFKSIDLRSVFEDDAALKVSFGTTFALAGFL